MAIDQRFAPAQPELGAVGIRRVAMSANVRTKRSEPMTTQVATQPAGLLLPRQLARRCVQTRSVLEVPDVGVRPCTGLMGACRGTRQALLARMIGRPGRH